MEEHPKWITVPELARELRVTKTMIYRMIEERRLTVGVVRVGRLLRLDRELVLESLGAQVDGKEQ